MSYSCEISFKKIESDKVYDFLVEMKKFILNNLDSIAEDNYAYAPFIRYLNKPFSKLENFAERDLCENWVRNCLTFKYFYLPEDQLLGVYGIPDCVKSLFDDCIYFQNSCDQDYEFSTWRYVDLFCGIAYKWQNYSDEYVINKLNLDEEQQEDLDYYRRSACYDEIWNLIGYTLEDTDSVIYIACLGYYELNKIIQFLIKCEETAKRKGVI